MNEMNEMNEVNEVRETNDERRQGGILDGRERTWFSSIQGVFMNL